MRGYTILSFIISTALAALLGALMLKDAHSFLYSQIETFRRSRETLQQIRLRELLDSILKDSDSHRLNILPRVHLQGRITYANGDLNYIGSEASASTPDLSSDAISNISLQSSKMLRVLKATKKALNFEYTACAIYKRPLLDGEAQSFIGLGLDSLLYLRGKVQPLRRQRGCFILELTQKKNMFLNKSDNKLAGGLRILVPVEREYTIYLSKKGELRYAGHRAYENIENQPLLGQLLQVLFELKTEFNPAIAIIKGHFLFPQNRLFSYASLNHLSRMEYTNLLLN